MNESFSDIPLRESTPRRRSWGCLHYLVALVVLLIIGVFAVRYAFLYTALPFNVVANGLQKLNPKIRITGISGNISTGPSVQSIQWGDDPAHPSEITGLRFKYSLADLKSNKALIIEDAGVARAHLDLADFGVWKTQEASPSEPSVSRSPSSAPAAPSFGGVDLQQFEIRQILIEDVLITNRNSPFRLSIPKVSWKNFKVTRRDGEPGDLEIVSDRLTVHTQPGRTLSLAGTSISFEKTYEGVLQPLAFEGLLQPLSFTCDVLLEGAAQATLHFSAAGGQIEAWSQPDGAQHLNVRRLEAAKWIDAPKVYGPSAADLPSEITLTAQTSVGEKSPASIEGTVKLGVLTLEIEPLAATDPAALNETILQASHRDGAGQITWSLPLRSWPQQYRPTFSSDPVLAPRELLARVFLGQAYDTLKEEEKKIIEARVPLYFPPPPKAAASDTPEAP